jgi:hypothetical protein
MTMTTVEVTKKIALTMGSNRQELKPGRHQLTDAQMSLWFMPGLIKSGAVVIVSDIPAKPKKLNYATHKIVLGEGSKPVVKRVVNSDLEKDLEPLEGTIAVNTEETDEAPKIRLRRKSKEA